ncbi:MAG: hypothetical protein KC613_24350 [Myxococcales bacterium]|nr:hypothetical protein [Myxococcales bacterium]MCB9522810.1 hypothetical protein [Myxococcales bacterium]
MRRSTRLTPRPLWPGLLSLALGFTGPALAEESPTTPATDWLEAAEPAAARATEPAAASYRAFDAADQHLADDAQASLDGHQGAIQEASEVIVRLNAKADLAADWEDGARGALQAIQKYQVEVKRHFDAVRDDHRAAKAKAVAAQQAYAKAKAAERSLPADAPQSKRRAAQRAVRSNEGQARRAAQAANQALQRARRVQAYAARSKQSRERAQDTLAQVGELKAALIDALAMAADEIDHRELMAKADRAELEALSRLATVQRETEGLDALLTEMRRLPSFAVAYDESTPVSELSLGDDLPELDLD